MAKLVTCADCGASISPSASACPSCGRRMELDHALSLGRTLWASSRKIAKYAVGCLGVLVVGFVLLGILAILVGPPKAADPEGEAASHVEWRVGDTAYLYRAGGAGNVLVAADLDALAELTRAVASEDLGAFVRMKDAGRAAYLPNGTKGIVLYRYPHSLSIRIVEGPPGQAGRRWWVESRYAVKSSP